MIRSLALAHGRSPDRDRADQLRPRGGSPTECDWCDIRQRLRPRGRSGGGSLPTMTQVPSSDLTLPDGVRVIHRPRRPAGRAGRRARRAPARCTCTARTSRPGVRWAREVLWVSEAAVFAPGKAIRGGVPICFPWFAGGLDGDLDPGPRFRPDHRVGPGRRHHRRPMGGTDPGPDRHGADPGAVAPLVRRRLPGPDGRGRARAAAHRHQHRRRAVHLRRGPAHLLLRRRHPVGAGRRPGRVALPGHGARRRPRPARPGRADHVHRRDRPHLPGHRAPPP